MPHSSGGGSHGGGSHGGSHGGSGGSPSGISNKYYPGSKRYVYYTNHKPEYIYSNSDPTKVNIHTLIGAILTIAMMVLIAPFMIIATLGTMGKPISDSYSDKGVAIIDNAGVLTDSAELEEELNVFYEKTHISPTLVTVNNEDWQSHYTSLENYAYEWYVTHYDDESHWVIIYSQPVNPHPSFNEWYFEGMQGDDTDRILTSTITGKFNDEVYTHLLDTKDYSIADSFGAALHNQVNEKVLNPFAAFMQSVFVIISFLLFEGIFIAFLIYMTLPKKKYKNAMECPLEVTEETCDYCGEIYIVGFYTTCPHCGGVIKPHKYIIDENGNKKVIQ